MYLLQREKPMENAQSDSGMINCMSCGSPMLKTAIFCPNCDRPQTTVQGVINRRAHLYGSLKWLSGVLFIPVAIFVAGTIVSTVVKSEEQKTRQLDGLITLMSEFDHRFSGLYHQKSCAGVSKGECFIALQEAIENYELARIKAATFIVTNFPGYVGGVELLSVLSHHAIDEARDSWERYIVCSYDVGQLSHNQCYEERNRFVLPSLSLSDTIIDLLRCAIQESLAAELDVVCNAKLDKLYEPLITTPYMLLLSHDGTRDDGSLLEYSHTLFDQLILPGSGLSQGELGLDE